MTRADDRTLAERVKAELTPVDMEQRLRDYLDECYDFSIIGPPFSHMIPSRVLEECDPVAFRCGVADIDHESENVEEVGGELYDRDEVQAIRDEIEAEAEESAEAE